MKNLKKLLFVTYENPSSNNSGDRIYTNNILHALFKLKYKIDLLCYSENNEHITSEKFTIKSVMKKPKSKADFIFSLKPGMIVNRETKLYTTKLKQIINDNHYDLIFINHFKMIFCLQFIRELFSKKIIFVSHNSEFLLSMNNAKFDSNPINRIVYFQDALKTRFYENKMIKKVDYITSISKYDYDYHLKRFPFVNNLIVRPVLKRFKIDIRKKNMFNILIVGNYTWKPKAKNISLFLKSKNLDILKSEGFKINIVGNADKQLIEYVNSKFDFIKMHGRVDDLTGFYEESKIAIIPELLGGGFKLKVAEAAYNKSAIFSIKGAISNSLFKKNKHFFEYNTFDELIMGIIDLKYNKAKIENIIQKAYVLVNKNYNFQNIINTLKDI